MWSAATTAVRTSEASAMSRLSHLDADLGHLRRMQAFERRARDHHGEVVGLVGKRAGGGAIVDGVAELVEHPARGRVAGEDRRVDAREAELGERERVEHHGEPGAQALAL